MGIIPESHIPQLKSDLEKAQVNPVTLTVFTQEIESQYCTETREIAEELSSLNNKIIWHLHRGHFSAGADFATR
jgi:hypothetical protein